MASDSLERIAELAVSQYGADRLRVDEILRAVEEKPGNGADPYVLLEQARLLTPSQVQELRAALDKTQIDLQDLMKNGSPAGEGEDQLRDLRMLGEYHLLRRLGKGGMGAVFLGYHEKENRQVAIKILASDHAKHQPTLDRFYREAKSGALLNHANIVHNFGFGHDQATGLHYLVLEYVDGFTAHEWLTRFGKLNVGDAVHIALDVARALEHAHSRNIIHRDIKPGNILITKSGLAKLADLGLARRTDETSHLTHTRQGFGTPYYMPYEQAMNAKRADARSDIYALGATLYHLVCGEVPFPGMNALEIMDQKQEGAFLPAHMHNAAVPAELDRILARMLARDPQDRYHTASEVIVDLERSGLAAEVPSFIDPLDAYSDPLVRERLTAPAQATQLDVLVPPVEDYWYLLYRDARGNVCKAKMTGAQLRKRLRQSKLPAQAKVARTPKGPFVAVDSVPELAALPRVAKTKRPASVAPESDPLVRWWWMLAMTLVVSILTLMILVILVSRQ